MQINKMGAPKQQIFSERESLSKVDRTDLQFSSEYKKSGEQISYTLLNDLMNKIDDQGKRLGLIPTYSELKAYRNKVREFLSEAVGRMYLVNTENSWDYMGRRKMYTSIKKIDEHLAGLTEEVRQGQSRQISIMEKVDAIRGLLVDMYT